MDLGYPAEQVVCVAHDVLVGPHHEYAEVVGLAGIQRMQIQEVLVIVRRDVLADLAVRVAGQVDQNRSARRPLVEPRQRHHRKRLVDSPVIQHGLEHGEVAEVLVGELVLEFLDGGRHGLDIRVAQAL